MPDAPPRPRKRQAFPSRPRSRAKVSTFSYARTGRSGPMPFQRTRSRTFPTFYRELSTHFGTRMPEIFGDELERPAATMRWRPLLTENIHPQILAGYGDPAVLKTDDGYWLVATSNDAPDAFPLLHSSDLYIGSRGGSFSRKARSPAGPQRAATSPISGRPKWRRPVTNTGSASPRETRPKRSRSASPEAPARPARGSTTAHL